MNNKIVKEILEKKFKKSIFSGYDPFDVDHFFDQIIIYINDLLKIKGSLENEIESWEKKYYELLEQKNNLTNQNKILKNEINEYQKEGYGQKHLNRRMDKLEEKYKTILLQQQNKNK